MEDIYSRSDLPTTFTQKKERREKWTRRFYKGQLLIVKNDCLNILSELGPFSYHFTFILCPFTYIFHPFTYVLHQLSFISRPSKMNQRLSQNLPFNKFKNYSCLSHNDPKYNSKFLFKNS